MKNIENTREIQKDLQDEKVVLDYFEGDELAANAWKSKYAHLGEISPNDMHRRLAREFARIEKSYPSESEYDRNLLSEYGKTRLELDEERIFELFEDFRYVIPGGSVMSGAGTGNLVSLSNCFVIGSPKDSYSSIMDTRNEQVQLMKRRGGVGYDLSLLRPRGALVNNAAKSSTGAASFMDVCSDITNEVAQNGRRGALMLSMSINHPDVEEFITKKQDLTKVTGANISVKVTDEFMVAVQEDKDYILRFPVDTEIPDDLMIDDMPYNELWFYGYEDASMFFKKIKAKELWKTLMHCAWNTAEPGILFEDAMHSYSPDGIYEDFRMVSTNPCGEIPMGPYDSCRLMHINLASFVQNEFESDAKIDYDNLYRVSYELVRLADDLVDLEIESIENIISKIERNNEKFEVSLWKKLLNTSKKGRRCGIGFTGLADMIAKLGVKYCSDECIEIVDKVMRCIFTAQLDCEIDLAILRGKFEVEKNEFESDTMNSWYDFVYDEFRNQAERMMKYGRRHISWSTVAPTGTVSIMARTSSGIEPVFLPYYERKKKCMNSSDRVDYTDIKGENYTLFMVLHPNLEKWYKKQSDKEWFDESIANSLSSCKPEVIEEIFKKSPYYGSTAPEIDWHQRVKLQGYVQRYITHSISSTINLPKSTTEEEIADIYMEAWKYGNKGQTIYRDGCREGVMNQVGTSVKNKNRDDFQKSAAPKRPKVLDADFYTVKVKGNQFVVVVGLYKDRPYEIFAYKITEPLKIKSHKGKIEKVSKMHYKFESDIILIPDLLLENPNIEEKAATLYSSMLLRHGVDIEYIIKTAKKVNDNISSFSSAMCRILSKYTKENVQKEHDYETCPSCGGRLIRDAGCKRCLDCTYSVCL